MEALDRRGVPAGPQRKPSGFNGAFINQSFALKTMCWFLHLGLRAIFWPPIKKLLVIKAPEDAGEWGFDGLEAEGLRVGLRKAKARNRLA